MFKKKPPNSDEIINLMTGYGAWNLKMNCWEFKKCGREKSCPAYPDHGRDCAQVAGTLCGGKVQGIFAMKIISCMECDFYKSSHYAHNAHKKMAM